MKYRKLGNSDLEVSAIALGTWVFGGDCWGEADDEKSLNVVAEAIDKGINFIDTAPVYGSGRSEEIIGKAIKGKRDKVIIATKLGLRQEGTSIKHDLSASFIKEEIENSLRRLGVETIDLYQCHWPDPNTPMDETFKELNALVAEGKVRYIGVSNFTPDQLKEAGQLAEIQSNQMRYSILDRDIENSQFPLCGEKKMSILSYGSLGGGILTGKYKKPPQLSKGDVRSWFYKFYKEPLWSKVRDLVSVLEGIADARKVPVSQVAINWVLGHGEVASCIAGCRTSLQLDMNVTATDWELSGEELGKIEEGYKNILN